MSSAGITIGADVKIKYEELKKDRAYRYIVCAIPDGKEVAVDRTGSRDATYEDMLALLSAEHPAYAIFDFEYNDSEGRAARKIVLLLWTPDAANIKEKMLYTSTRDAIRRVLVGIVSYEAADLDEASFASVSERLSMT
jgi:cofilin